MTVFRKISLMLSDVDDYNVNIQVGENHNIKEFHAHSNVLRARSPYFKSAFSNKWIAKTNNNMIEFENPNINPTVFEIILKRDDLQIEEIVACDYLIKWGINQTLDLGINNNNKIKWNNNKNYESLKKTLN
ncbi:hypothetical protein RhiirC2_842263 [Rhizophagus irregularis]|uniref:BTB domain-containing protein n=1 Tax=Rhizophagus irregularis TaxID=588596 RepID=A0A2N1P108_9GLOM|nr:hypothetical protein RhiirC2_842263 [Rhizophagus irregularis]